VRTVKPAPVHFLAAADFVIDGYEDLGWLDLGLGDV
jgi:hypothetical protein